MYTPKLFKNIINGFKSTPLWGKIILLPLTLISLAGFIGLFINQPILLIPTMAFAIAYETTD